MVKPTSWVVDMRHCVVNDRVHPSGRVHPIRDASGVDRATQIPDDYACRCEARSSSAAARSRDRACRTTSCPSSMSARAAARPRPSVLPVMKTRATGQPRGSTRTIADRARPSIIGFKYVLPAYFARYASSIRLENDAWSRRLPGTAKYPLLRIDRTDIARAAPLRPGPSASWPLRIRSLQPFPTISPWLPSNWACFSLAVVSAGRYSEVGSV
jgi:hypothetical protein